MNYNRRSPATRRPCPTRSRAATAWSSTTTARPRRSTTTRATSSAFLAWAADPRLEERKRLGLLVMIYLLITAVLLYFAKRRIWTKAH